MSEAPAKCVDLLQNKMTSIDAYTKLHLQCF
jgi:hypothetical protein